MRTIAQIQEALRAGTAPILDLTDEEIDALSDAEVEELQVEFGAHVLMKLPPRERAFMAWLKTEDPSVHEDLWEDDEELLVSLSFLGDLRKGGPGFAICELAFHDNYYFTQRHVKPTGLEAMPGIFAVVPVVPVTHQVGALGMDCGPGHQSEEHVAHPKHP